jgi:hypothetical protein
VVDGGCSRVISSSLTIPRFGAEAWSQPPARSRPARLKIPGRALDEALSSSFLPTEKLKSNARIFDAFHRSSGRDLVSGRTIDRLSVQP